MSGFCSDSHIKTHGCVSAAKKAVWHTNVLFTGIATLLFSTPHISIATTSIFIKFTYFMPSIYATRHIKCEENCLVFHEICFPEYCPIFFTFFFFFAPFYKSNFEPTKYSFLVDRFLSNLHTYKALCGLS